MRSYPKVLQYYHSRASDEIYTAEDLLILEKTDGQNFRVILYVDEFADKYSEELQSFNPVDGDVFVGTKGNIRGRMTDEPDSFEFEFERVLTYLQTNLDIAKLREYYHEYEAPLVLFGEHMTPHSLDYNYVSDPPPAFLGFDIYVQETADPDVPANPIEDTFDNFLGFAVMKDIFTTVGLDVITPIDLDPELPFNPTEYEIPESRYADITAEGVVLRSDSLGERVKITTEEFEERNMYIWGMREDQAESGAELFVAKYVTNSRIHKQIYPYIHKNEEITATQIATDVLTDAFTEEWDDIGSLEAAVSIPELWSVTITRCEHVLEQMKTRSELHQEDIENLYEMQDVDIDSTQSAMANQSQSTKPISLDSTNDNSLEAQLVTQLFPEDYIHKTAQAIADESEKSVGSWTIPDVKTQLQEELWIQHYVSILDLDCELRPATIEQELMNQVVSCLK